MPSILHEIRRLDEAHQRGELDRDEYFRARAAAKSVIEEAEIMTEARLRAAMAHEDAPGVTQDDAPEDEIALLWRRGAMVLGAIAALVPLTAWLIGDLMLAFTLAIAVLAFVTLRAFKQLDDQEELALDDSGPMTTDDGFTLPPEREPQA